MFFWFVVMAPVLVAEIFRSPMVDYRLVVVGALLPLLELPLGHAWPLHSLLGSVLALAVVMGITVGRRLLRRRLLGIPIGMMFHLVLDGSWASAAVFWWPVFGFDLSEEPVPETQSIGWRLVLEVAAVGVAVWAHRRYGLDDAANRRRLLTTGHLNRAFVS